MSRSATDPAFLPHSTPTGIAEARYAAAAAKRRRRPGAGGLPKPEHVYRPSEDRATLQAIVAAAWEAHLAEAIPADWRERTGRMLLDELNRIYPAEHMAIVEQYECHRMASAITVTHGIVHEQFALLRPRPLPRHVVQLGGQVPFYLDGVPPRAVPDAAKPYFAALAEQHARKHEDFDRASSWAGWEVAQKRAPSWADIERQFPRIGAWMANIRGNA